MDEFKTAFSGDIILPNDARYETARKTLMDSGSPALVVLPHSNSDVALAIKYARDNSLKLSIRSGGHSNVGFGTNDGGLVIDLSDLNKVKVIDADKMFVRVGSGARWIDVATTLKPHGLAISSGDTQSVGVGGLTLGGGIGWMVRRDGLAIDNLVAAEIVLADGTVKRADKNESPDLFWAIRGGGGNFGVVTSFEFTAHPVGNVYAGFINYGVEDIARTLTGWRNHMRQAPQELTTMVVVMPPFGDAMPAAVTVMVCYASDDEALANAAIDPLRNLGKVNSDTVALKPYANVLEEAHPPAGMKIIVKNGFAREFNDELINIIAKTHGKPGAPALQIRSLGGAMNNVAPDATAFAHRDSEVLMIDAHFLPPDATDEMVQKMLEPWNRMEKFTTGSYVNLMSEATQKQIDASYPKSTYDRLAEIKQKYDPQNVFNQNYNVKPNQ
jgi:FAD/FMN-containing dehydrogenase